MTLVSAPLLSEPVETERMPEGVSEVAHFISKLVAALPVDVVDELVRLLRRRLTMVDTHQIRYARLGLLIDLVSVGTGEIPSTRVYEDERARRAQAGETHWPTHSTLHAAYGSWVKAVEAAMLLWRDGPSARVSFSNAHHERVPRYSYDEVVDALVSCYQQIGTWPNDVEYDEWRRIARELARNSGTPTPRYPNRGAWKGVFDRWELYLAAAKRRAAQIEGADADASTVEKRTVYDEALAA